MASSKDQKLEAKHRLLDLQDEVKEFKDRLRHENEQTNQSIDQMSIDLTLKCSNVWQEFDSLVEKARLKASEICDEMRQRTQDEQEECRRTLREKENLLEEAAKWLNDLRQLLGADDDDDDVVGRLQTEGSELTSRLRQSSSPVRKGQFLVTFPDWCRRAINDLQNEVVDFVSWTPRTWPPRDLKVRTEFCLKDWDLRVIESIAVSDEDGHVFVVERGFGSSIFEFSESGEFIGKYRFGEEIEIFCPLDICRLPEDHFVVCGQRMLRWELESVGVLLFLTRQKSQPFLKKEKQIHDTKEETFFSVCQMEEKIFVSVLGLEKILCYSKEGMKLKTIKIGGWPGSGDRRPVPLIRADPTTGNLWLTEIGKTECFIFDQEGKILQKLETEKEILGFCSDDFGHFYFCDKKGIFSILPEKNLKEFPENSEDYPKIFVSQGKLFLSFEKDRKKLIKIFQIN